MKKNPVKVNKLLGAGKRNYEINKNLARRDYEINKKKSADQIKFHVKHLRPVFGDRVASLVRDVKDYKL
jgi:hypothetical protein